MPAPASLRPPVGGELRADGSPASAAAISSPVPAAPTRVATGARSRASSGRRFLHLAVGAGSWLGFAALWIWQLNVSVPPEWPVAVAALVGVLLAYSLLVPAWVRWNRSIYRRRHRRNAPVQVPVDFGHDRLGRTVAIAPEVELDPSTVVVTVSADDSTKLYTAGI
jgi:multisubunit Na+/H+ antiporter MnhE subunit